MRQLKYHMDTPISQCDRLQQQGYLLLDKNDYQLDISQLSTKPIEKIFSQLQDDPSPGSRQRAYLKFIWERQNNRMSLAADQRYFQSAKANSLDGGSYREFKQADTQILKDPLFTHMLENNKQLISEYADLKDEQTLIIGLHFVRYCVKAGDISYSSPVWLHVDDEPLVFVHLIGLSNNAIGGDNLIATKAGVLAHNFRLQNVMDTLVLNRSVMHAVTPLGSTNGCAHRDIILCTVEPNSTNDWVANDA